MIFLSLAPQGSPSPWFLSVPGEMLFVLLSISSGGHNSVVKHWYFSIPPFEADVHTCLFFWLWEVFSCLLCLNCCFSITYVDAPKGQSQGTASLR